jgi:hypothetical protein
LHIPPQYYEIIAQVLHNIVQYCAVVQALPQNGNPEIPILNFCNIAIRNIVSHFRDPANAKPKSAVALG